jgi:hypothetical protein
MQLVLIASLDRFPFDVSDRLRTATVVVPAGRRVGQVRVGPAATLMVRTVAGRDTDAETAKYGRYTIYGVIAA